VACLYSFLEFRKFDCSNLTSSSDPRLPSLVLLMSFYCSCRGCGKSTLLHDCDQIQQRLEPESGESSTRRLIVRVGDKVKGKYWPTVTTERLQAQSSVYLADKNVPVSTWELVGKVAATSKGVAVPVIPDSGALETVTIEGIHGLDGDVKDTRKHFYPFSLRYLAVCMTRVCDRVAGTHAGKLDRGTSRACLIVMKFFSMYRYIAAENFCNEIHKRFAGAGALSASLPIKVPFFRIAEEKLPNDFELLLIEALQVFVSRYRLYS
jgi:hypothetical protein